MKTRYLLILLGIFVLFLFTFSAQAEQRLVLAEKFTNTSCGPCYYPNLVMDTLAANYPDYFVVVRYHVWWPSDTDPFYLFTPAENGIRTNYYGVTSVPHLQVDGIIETSSYWTTILARYQMESPLRITVEGTFNEDTKNGTLEVTIAALEQITAAGLFVRIALTESDIHWNAPNGLRTHNQVMRYMIPFSTGRLISIDEGDTIVNSEVFSCPDPLVPENCEIVVWVQSDQTREVLQAARIAISELEDDASITESKLPADLYLEQNYPNPFNASTVINYSIDETSHLELVVYDLCGRKISVIQNGILNPGVYQAIWDGTDDNGKPVASGIYFYSLKTQDGSQSKRMLLLK